MCVSGHLSTLTVNRGSSSCCFLLQSDADVKAEFRLRALSLNVFFLFSQLWLIIQYPMKLLQGMEKKNKKNTKRHVDKNIWLYEYSIRTMKWKNLTKVIKWL